MHDTLKELEELHHHEIELENQVKELQEFQKQMQKNTKTCGCERAALIGLAMCACFLFGSVLIFLLCSKYYYPQKQT